MDYREFKRQLGKAGLTGVEFAELINVNKNTIFNLASKEDVPDHLAIIASLIAEMKDNNINFVRVINRIELRKKKARGDGF